MRYQTTGHSESNGFDVVRKSHRGQTIPKAYWLIRGVTATLGNPQSSCKHRSCIYRHVAYGQRSTPHASFSRDRTHRSVLSPQRNQDSRISILVYQQGNQIPCNRIQDTEMGPSLARTAADAWTNTLHHRGCATLEDDRTAYTSWLSLVSSLLHRVQAACWST